jgi:hypothetical protein
MSWPSMKMRPALGISRPGQHAQQRGLAAAGAAEQAEELALVDVQGDVVHGDEITEAFADALDAQERPGIGRFQGSHDERVRLFPGARCRPGGAG